MTPTNRITQFFDPYMATLSEVENTDHNFCCRLRVAAEADLEAAWQEREGAKVLRDTAARDLADVIVNRNIAARDRKAWHGFAWFCGGSVLLHIVIVAGRWLL